MDLGRISAIATLLALFAGIIVYEIRHDTNMEVRLSVLEKRMDAVVKILLKDIELPPDE